MRKPLTPLGGGLLQLARPLPLSQVQPLGQLATRLLHRSAPLPLLCFALRHRRSLPRGQLLHSVLLQILEPPLPQACVQALPAPLVSQGLPGLSGGLLALLARLSDSFVCLLARLSDSFVRLLARLSDSFFRLLPHLCNSFFRLLPRLGFLCQLRLKLHRSSTEPILGQLRRRSRLPHLTLCSAQLLRPLSVECLQLRTLLGSLILQLCTLVLQAPQGSALVSK
jgi:hypothetical protein